MTLDILLYRLDPTYEKIISQLYFASFAMSDTFFDDTLLFSGPSFHIDLPALDALHPVYYSRRLFIFRCSSSAQRDAQLAALKTGLQALVLRCPILGGIVVPLPQDIAIKDKPDWRTFVPDRGIELIVRDLRTAIAPFAELEAANFLPAQLPYDLLVPIPQDLGNDRPFAACKAQFSAIEGGTIFSFSMSHSVGDGAASNELMRILSEEVRLAQKDSRDVTNEVKTTVGLDRNPMRNMTSETAFDIAQHPAYKWKTTPSPQQPTTHPFEATLPEIPVLLHISARGLAQLKADATLPGAPPISTHDALSALLWKTVLLIRSRRSALAQDLPGSTMGNIFLPSDARRHINFPASYVGNAVYQLTAGLDLTTLFSPSGLQIAASAIRRAITSVNPAIASSLFAKINEEWLDWAFMGRTSTTGVALGTGWTSGSLYTEDWGEAFGKIVRVRYPGAFANGSNQILPKLPDGAAEFTVAVMEEEVQVLKGVEGFGKYLEM